MPTLPGGVELAVVGPSFDAIEKAQRFFVGTVFTNAVAKNVGNYWADAMDKIVSADAGEKAAAEKQLRAKLFALTTMATGLPQAQKFPKPKELLRASREAADRLTKAVKIKPVPWKSPKISDPLRRKGKGSNVALALAFGAGYLLKGK